MKLGQKVKFEVFSYELTSYWDTPFGVIYLYTFRDFLNNIFIWKSQKFIEDDIYSIKGRIKKIENFNGNKEYVLTYCKVNA